MVMAHIAIIGPEAAAAQVLVDSIEERDVDCEALTLLSDTPYDAEELTYQKRKLLPQAVADFDFGQADIVFLMGAVDESVIQSARGEACYVIDCRADVARDGVEALPVIPDVNASLLADVKPGDIVRAPCSSSVMLSLILNPLGALAAIRSVSVCCHLPAIRRDKEGVDELVGQTARLMNGLPAEKKIFSEQIAFNVLPGDSVRDEQGNSIEEAAITSDVRQVLGQEAMLLSATCLHVPVFYSQSMVVNVEFAEPVSVGAISSSLKKVDGVRVSTSAKTVPTAVSDMLSSGELVISRIRQVSGSDRHFCLWSVADELRRGVAVNAVQIAEILIKSYL
ncbi:aspartate-semialdehyde dehydrogenase [Aurantivibrio plasticivorans]